MSYVPKKLINPGLFATGDRFLDPNTGKPYNGPYHSNFDGSVYSGANPYDPNKTLLVPNPKNSPPTRVVNTPQNRNYEDLNTKNTDLLKYGKDPLSFTPVPSEIDYRRGSIKRYFAKRITEKPNRIIEIQQNSYDSLDNKDGDYNYAVWRPFQMLWRISGDSEQEVTNTNKRLVELANKNFRGIKSYLRNLTQFYKPIVEKTEPDRILQRTRPTLDNNRQIVRRQSRGGGSSPRTDLY